MLPIISSELYNYMFACLFTYLLDLYPPDFNQVFLLDVLNFLKVSVLEFIPKH